MCAGGAAITHKSSRENCFRHHYLKLTKWGPALLRWAKSRDSYRRIARELSLRFESLAFVGGHISLENTEISHHRPCVRCAAIRIAQLAFIRLTFVPHEIAEWLARVDRVRWTLAIGVLLRKTSAISIELLFRNAPGKTSWTGLSLVWFAGVTPESCRGATGGRLEILKISRRSFPYSSCAGATSTISATCTSTYQTTCGASSRIARLSLARSLFGAEIWEGQEKLPGVGADGVGVNSPFWQ